MVDITVLYYNEEYLNKYSKEVPKTWEELIDTSKYILNEEKRFNNTNIVPYNGLFCCKNIFIYKYFKIVNISSTTFTLILLIFIYFY